MNERHRGTLSKQGFDVTRLTGHEARPVIVSLPVMALEVFAALLHFNEHDGFPNEICEGNTTAILVGFANAEFGLPANIERTGLNEGLKEAVEEDLRLAFFVAGDVLSAPRDEFGEFFREWRAANLHAAGRAA